MWFHKKNIFFYRSITDPSIRGYVLPHAGTNHTGKIISHTLRFKPSFKFHKVCILYYPVSNQPNIQGKYYHEYYVPMKCIKFFIDYKWNLKKISFLGINLRDDKPMNINLSDTLIIVSADFSHYLPLQQAIMLENKAAHSLMFKQHQVSRYTDIIDHIISFKTLHKLIPSDWYLHWIGRTRSLGEKGVGYLTFLIKQPLPLKNPHGIFVTCYDTMMNARECLGEWFTSNKKWTQSIEGKLIQRVINNGQSYSRLTGGKNKQYPIKFYTVTYLYRDNKKMIRGYHGIKYKAFYLPEILLEHVYPNGRWIQDIDKKWQDGNFMIKETLDKLTKKANSFKKVTKSKKSLKQLYHLYKCEVRHFKI
jgi:hypothetical protein